MNISMTLSYLIQTLHEDVCLLLAWLMLTQGVEGDSAPLLVNREAPELAGNIIPKALFISKFLAVVMTLAS